MMATVQSQQHFFEGAEKLLEVWFASNDGTDRDLRTIDRRVNIFSFAKYETKFDCFIASFIRQTIAGKSPFAMIFFFFFFLSMR